MLGGAGYQEARMLGGAACRGCCMPGGVACQEALHAPESRGRVIYTTYIIG
jgi:hypothetical protein